jgi:hypothetical protein
MELAGSAAECLLRGKAVGRQVDSARGDAGQTLQHPRPTVANIRDKPLRQRNRVRHSVVGAPGYGAQVAWHSRELQVGQGAQDLFVGVYARLQAPEELDDQNLAEAK